MNTANARYPSTSLTVSGIDVQVVRKPIKNLHLGVYPPDGRVRVSAPMHLSDDNVRLAIISKLGWIRKKQAHFTAQPRQSRREMVSGETHFVFGRRYRLDVVERVGRHEVEIKNNSWLTLYVNPGTTRENRAKALDDWYRALLKERVPPLIEKWQPVMGVDVAEWRVRKMKTRWGTCNIGARRIWLNLELAKKPPECLQYIVVHEMVHLLERYHNDNFRAHMDRFLPQWRLHRDVLNSSPLADETWEY